MKTWITICLIMFSFCDCNSQKLDSKLEKEVWEKRVFSIENFMNKFNGTLDLNNEIIPDNDTAKTTRIRSILRLINYDKSQISDDSIKLFVLSFIDLDPIKKLSFNDPNWFAEVKILSEYKGLSEHVYAYVEYVETEDDTHFWTVRSLSGNEIGNTNLSDREVNFPPNSHGNDFSSIPGILNKKLKSGDLKLVKLDNHDIKFILADELVYHFFTMENWHFTVEEYNRKNQLSGWLISKIEFIPERDKSKEIQRITTSKKSP